MAPIPAFEKEAASVFYTADNTSFAEQFAAQLQNNFIAQSDFTEI